MGGGAPAGPTRLGIVVVSYNTRDLLRRCLASLAAAAPRGLEAEVRVVDNASDDGSAAMVTEEFPEVGLMALGENRGYAAGANTALRDWVWATDPPAGIMVLNADTELRAGTLEAFARALIARPKMGLAGPALRYPDGSFQHAAFRYPGFVQTMLEFVSVPRLTPSRINGRYPRSRYADGPFRVDFPLGACLFARTAAVQRVGLLDEAYGMYCEEIDWAMRFHAAGYEVLCLPDAQVVHHAGASTRQFRDRMYVALWRSRLRLFRRHYGRLHAALLAATVRAGLALARRRDAWALRAGRLTPEACAARLAAYREILG